MSEAARRGLAKVWDILSLVAARLGQVYFQNGDKRPESSEEGDGREKHLRMAQRDHVGP